jgi:hypothetical protein
MGKPCNGIVAGTTNQAQGTQTMTLDRHCHRTVLALPWLLNGSLAASERREVREHLIHCPQCRAQLAHTRETLAVFQAPAAAAPAEQPVASHLAATASSAAGRVLRHLSWAALIAVVLSSLAGAWLAGTSGSDQAQVQPRHPRPVATRVAAISLPTPAKSRVISTIGFEGGRMPSIPAASNRISTVDFEAGVLGTN